MVDPKAQRQGIGRLLLEAVVALSDSEQIPTILCSSREARGLYPKMGFKSIQTWMIDNEYWAREIARHDCDHFGTNDRQESWAKTYAGCFEEEAYMARGPLAS